MPTFADIRKELEANGCESITSLPGELKRLVGIPDLIGLGAFDVLLGTLYPLISIAAKLDSMHTDYWVKIQQLTPQLRTFLRSRYTNPLLWESSLPGPKILFKDYPDFTSFMAPTPPQAGNRLHPLKSLLLIGNYAEYYNFYVAIQSDRSIFGLNSLNNVANALRKSSDPTWNNFHLLLDHVPEWSEEGVEDWRDAFLHSVSKLPRAWGGRNYPGRYDFLFCLRDIAKFVRPKQRLEKDSSNSADSTKAANLQGIAGPDVLATIAPSAPHFNPLTGRETKTAPGFHTFLRRRSTTNENTEASAPDISTAYPQEGVTFDEPTKAQVVEALGVRYTNYRTAMDNQRLPWAWDCLNPIEVRSLVTSLLQPSVSNDKESTQCRLIIWLILLTGQPVSEILDFALNDQASTTQANGFIQGRLWQRHILLPPQAYTPKPQQSNHLCTHTNTVAFELPEYVFNLAAILELQETSAALHHSVHLGTALRLTPEAAEQMIRKYLGEIRGRDLRFLLGRLRKVLPKEIMHITQNPVITHLITALPTDAPPSGVYYSAFPVERLKTVYNEALKRILRGVG